MICFHINVKGISYDIPPVSPISDSHKYADGQESQRIVDEQCKDYPPIPLGCNVVVVRRINNQASTAVVVCC